MVNDGRRIENGDVREIAGLQKPAAFQMFALRGKRGDFSNGSFQRQEMSVANIVPEKTWYGAHGARMLMRFVGGTVQGHFTSV